MSRAFVKEDAAIPERLPEIPVSPHRNLVTPAGLAQIDAQLVRLRTELRGAADGASRAPIERDLRYWQARRATAELVAPQPDADTIRFGATVRLRRDDGREQLWRIVGEDEADPALGAISYTAPVARALIGKGVGDTVDLAGQEAEIIAIS